MNDQEPTAQESRLKSPTASDAPPCSAAAAAGAREADEVCWCCGGRTITQHCKIVCLNCGFMRDCSDP